MSLEGGWNITDYAKELPACELPQEVASAFTKATTELVGASYEPLMYVATQVVAGSNHMLLCRQTLSDLEHTIKIAKMTIYIPLQGDPKIMDITPLW